MVFSGAWQRVRVRITAMKDAPDAITSKADRYDRIEDICSDEMMGQIHQRPPHLNCGGGGLQQPDVPANWHLSATARSWHTCANPVFEHPLARRARAPRAE